MDELGQNKNNMGAIAAFVIVLLALIIGAYVYKQKTATPPTPADLTASQEETSLTPPETAPPETAPPEPATAENPVVVPTKELDLGPKVAPVPPVIANEAVKTMMAERSIGKVDAPIVIDEFASLTCGHCGAFHRETFDKFKTEFVDTGKVKMIFHEFPLNPPAIDASMILRCMPEDKFVSFMQLLFTEQDKWAYDEKYKDKLRQNAKLAGMSDDQFDKCLANEDLKKALIGEMKYAGDAYKVAATPSFVFNKGQKTLVGSQPLSEFEKTIGELSSAPAAAVNPAPQASPPEQPSAASSTESETPPAE